MSWTADDVGKTCPACGRKVELVHDQPGFQIIACSEFCSRHPGLREAWRNRKKGEFLVGPCGGCGAPIEDEYLGTGDWTCSDCYRKNKERRKTELLTATYYLLKGRKGQKAQELAQAIKLELKL